MAFIIANFILCLLGAVVFGFIFGWILSSLIRNEKLHEKFINIQDSLEKKELECKELDNKLSEKEMEIDEHKKEYFILKKEFMKKEMDIEEYEDREPISQETTAIEEENRTLKIQIQEYQQLENKNESLQKENDFLDNELTKAEEEAKKCSKELEEYKTISKGSTSLIQTNKYLQESAKTANKVIKIVHANIEEIEKKIGKIKKANENRKLDIPLLEIEKTVQTIDQYILATKEQREESEIKIKR